MGCGRVQGAVLRRVWGWSSGQGSSLYGNMRRRDAAAQWTPAPPSLENKIKDWLRLWNLGADGGRQIDHPCWAWTMFWAGSSNKPPSLPHSSWSKVSVDRASPTGLLSCSPNWRKVFLPLTLLNSLTSAASRVYRPDAGISFGKKNHTLSHFEPNMLRFLLWSAQTILTPRAWPPSQV